MKVYLLSLGAGVLVGVVYGLINVRSPAPPVIALIGLLGILLGEQVVPVGRRILSKAPEGLAVEVTPDRPESRTPHSPRDAGQG